jgi:tetratricopeptide (TPR) repeat protein
MTANKPGRNDPCPCGSGKKYKKCCGQDEAAQTPTSPPSGFSAAQALQSAMMHHQNGNLPQAETLYKQILQANPNQPDALHLLGLIGKQRGDTETAVKLMNKALAIKPDYVEAHVNLGATLQQQNKLQAAAASYRKALALRPNYAEVHSNLGVVLREEGKLDEAAECFLQALKLKPDFSEAFGNLDAVLKQMSEPADALAYYRKVLELSPLLVAAQQGAYLALSRTVPEWHVPMMNEHKRNQAYLTALEGAVTPQTSVFEIGTGSGLLAMMAARLGAKQVTTCEAVPLIAETAQRIVADNKLEKTIKVIAKRSTEVELAGKADILVSEIFSSELLGEYVLPSLEDAKRRLLKPKGRVIPAAGQIMIALFGGDNMRRNLMVDDSFGFNLQRFNGLVSKKRMIARNDLNIEMLSDPVAAFTFDFEKDDTFPAQNKTLEITAKTGGRCYGIIQWIRLQMDKDTVFENHPALKTSVSNWQQCAYVFDQPVDLKRGQVAVISATHDRTVPWFFLDKVTGDSLK